MVVMEVSVQTAVDEAEADRVEQLVETLANDIIPSLSEAAGVSGTDLAARLMAELGYIVGFTSHPADALDVQQLGPERGQALLHLPFWRLMLVPHHGRVIRWGQRASVEIAIGGQGPVGDLHVGDRQQGDNRVRIEVGEVARRQVPPPVRSQGSE